MVSGCSCSISTVSKSLENGLLSQSLLKLSTNYRIADGQPTSCLSPSPCTERLRQAFIGYDNLPKPTQKQPLRIYVHDSYNRDKLRLRLGINEFQTFINCLPMATVCSEARSHATEFCHTQVGLVNLFYVIDEPFEPSDIGDVILEPIFVQPPTTIMITTAYRRVHGLKRFNSAEHLVEVVNRVFGSGVEHIILSPWAESMSSLEEIYWPHTAQIQKLREIEPVFTGDQNHRQPAIFMTPEGTTHTTFTDRTSVYYMDKITQHLLKFREIVDASTQKLPRLKSIELELHTYSWGEPLLIRFKATIEDGVLWVNWSDIKMGFPNHDFAGFDGYGRGRRG